MTDSLHSQIKAGVIKILQDLQLEDLPGGIQDQIMPDPANVVFPCVVVTTEGETERLAGGDTEIQFNEYPVRVFLMDRIQTQVRHDAEVRYITWRKMILDAFNQRARNASDEKIPGVPSVFRVDVRPAPIFDPKMQQYQMVVSGCVVVCEAAEPRRKRR